MSLKVDIKNCQRCDQDHTDVIFEESPNTETPPQYSHRGACPVTGQPLAFRSGDTPEPEGSEYCGQKYTVK